MSVTLGDIATRAKLSKVTVSHILHGRGTVRPETRQRVLDIAKELDYRPNNAARAMRTGRFDTVGLLIRQKESWMHLPIDLLEGINSVFSSEGLRMTILEEPIEKFLGYKEETMSAVIKEMMVDGLLLGCWSRFTDLDSGKIEKTKLPMVFANLNYNFNCVYPDNSMALQVATEHLIKMGHERITFMNLADPNHFSSKERLASYRSTMRSAGLAPNEFISRRPRLERLGMIEQFLSSSDFCSTAILCCNRSTALPILYAASRLNIDIPRDLSLISIDGEVIDDCGIQVSTVTQDQHEVGMEVARMFLLRSKSGGVPVHSVIIPWEKIEGQTCQPPNMA